MPLAGFRNLEVGGQGSSPRITHLFLLADDLVQAANRTRLARGLANLKLATRKVRNAWT